MSAISTEIHRKLSLIDKLKAELKEVREAEKAELKATAARRHEALKEARQLMRKFKITSEDLATS